MDNPSDMHDRCYRYLIRVLQHAQRRDEDGTFNDKETREMVVHAWKVFLNCPKPPGWIPEPPLTIGNMIKDLIGVQPMTGPSAMVATLRYRYGNTTSEE